MQALASQGTSGKDGFRARSALAAAVFVAAALPYLQTIHHDFVRFDDYDYVVNNAVVRSGLTWHGVRWAFTTFTEANWHPLTWLSHMLDCQLFGLWAGGHHLSSALLHASNAVLLFFLVLRLGLKDPLALMAALAFAVHPLRVESVAWVSERKDVLAAFFWILALLAYVRFTRKRSLSAYTLVGLCFALGLLAKPMVVTLPVVLILLDVWPLQRNPLLYPGRRIVAEKGPLFALSAASAVVTLYAQARGGAVQDLENLPLSARLANACMSYWAYLWDTIYPTGLAFYYPHPALVSGDIFWTLYVPGALAGVGLAIALAMCIKLFPRRPYVLVGCLWYAVTLFPVVGIVQVGNQARADRYTYLPLIGIYLAAMALAGEMLGARRWARRFFYAFGAAVIALWAVLAWNQVAIWRNSESLFLHALKVTTNNYVAHTNLGNLFARAGDAERASAHYARALEIRPGLPEAHHNWGVLLAAQGDYRMAVAHFRAALLSRPRYASAHHQLGRALVALNRKTEALAHIERAVLLDPENLAAQWDLGRLSAQLGQWDQAWRAYETVLTRRPDCQVVLEYAWLAAIRHHAIQRPLQETVGSLLDCVDTLPRAQVLRVLAALRGSDGDWARACELANEALASAPAMLRPLIEQERSAYEQEAMPAAEDLLQRLYGELR